MGKLIKWIFFLFLFLVLVLPGLLWVLVSFTNLPSQGLLKLVERYYYVEEFDGSLQSGLSFKKLLTKSENKEKGIRSIGEAEIKYTFDWENNLLIIRSFKLFNLEGLANFDDLKDFFSKMMEKKKDLFEEMDKKLGVERGGIALDRVQLEKMIFKDVRNEKEIVIGDLSIEKGLISRDFFSFDLFSLKSSFLNLEIYRKGKNLYHFQGEILPFLIEVLKRPFPFYGRIQFDQKEKGKLNELLLGLFEERGLVQVSRNHEGELKRKVKIENVDLDDYLNLEQKVKIVKLKSIPTTNKKEMIVDYSELLIDQKKHRIRKIGFSKKKLELMLFSDDDPMVGREKSQSLVINAKKSFFKG